MDTEKLASKPSCESPLPNATVMEDIQILFQALMGLIQDRFRLAALETQQAGLSLVAIIIAGVMVAFFLNGAWLGFVTFCVLKMIEHGIMLSNAILLAVACNLLLVLILLGVIRRKSCHLIFPTLLRRF